VRYEADTYRRTGSADRIAAGVLLGGVTVFQVALAAGAPWGQVAWSGSHEGTLPANLRLASAAAAVLWGTVAVAVVWELPRSTRAQRVLLRTVAAGSVVGAALNLASPSAAERAIWVPVSAAVAVLTWRAARALPVTDASAVPVA
jgi:hypothetical protein